MLKAGETDFADMLDRQAPGCVHHRLGARERSIVLAHRNAPAHEFSNPGTPHLGVMVVPHYQLTQARFDLGTGWREHFCPEPQPVHVLPPNTAYRWAVNGPSTIVMLALPMSDVQSVCSELDASDPMDKLWAVMDRGFVDPLVYELIMRLWAFTKSDRVCPPLLLQSHMTCMLHALLTRGGTTSAAMGHSAGLSKSKLKAVLEVMEARLDDDVGLDELAAVCAMTRYHFGRQFRQSTGYAPYQYLLRRRIEKARALLVSTDDGIGDIGLAVGFGDAGHFSRTFTRHVGLSPQRYREAGH